MGYERRVILTSQYFHNGISRIKSFDIKETFSLEIRQCVSVKGVAENDEKSFGGSSYKFPSTQKAFKKKIDGKFFYPINQS